MTPAQKKHLDYIKRKFAETGEPVLSPNYRADAPLDALVKSGHLKRERVGTYFCFVPTGD